MDPLTHALSGAFVAGSIASPARLPARSAGITAVVASLFPDIDLLLRAVDTLFYLNHHQGLTHSLLMLPLWAALLAAFAARLSRWRYRWRDFFPFTLAGIAIHIAGDFITAYGVQLFAPLSTQRYALDLSFVVDPLLSAILLAGVAMVTWRRVRLAVPVTLVLLIGYLSTQWWLKERALALARLDAHSRHVSTDGIHALPQPFSPFHWLLIVRSAETYYSARLDLAAPENEPALVHGGWWARSLAAYRPAGALDWRQHAIAPTQAVLVAEAWHAPVLEPFRRFARFPAVYALTQTQDAVCVGFEDLRFSLPGLPTSFRYAVCRAHNKDWTLQRVRGGFYID